MSLRVASLSIYPVKSTAGLALADATVEARGLALDRRWMVVDAGGRFLTGRAHPALVTVTARPDGTGLALAAPGRDTLRITDATGAGRGERIPVEVWGSTVQAVTVDPAADRWLEELLGLPCRLVHMDAHAARGIDPEHARPGDEVSFADGYPLLLIGEASLADLATRTPGSPDMRRFRPNVTVAGGAPFAEDGWRRLRIGAVEFDVPKPCDRCVMTTIDPDTGVPDAGREPLLTLSRYRRDRTRGILFGVNLIPRGVGTVSVGDPVEILD